MNLSLIFFLTGILGFVLCRKNIILMLILIEIMLLAITFLILRSLLSFDDILDQTFAIYIIASAELATGLGIIIALKKNLLKKNAREMFINKNKIYIFYFIITSVKYNRKNISF